MHSYTVDLAISAEELDESAINSALGVRASRFVKKGEMLSPNSETRARHTSWVWWVGPPETKEWDSLESGLQRLLENFEPVKEQLLALGKSADVFAYCGHFGSGFSGGPSISAETLGRLSALGLGLTIKVYWTMDAPEQ